MDHETSQKDTPDIDTSFLRYSHWFFRVRAIEIILVVMAMLLLSYAGTITEDVIRVLVLVSLPYTFIYWGIARLNSHLQSETFAKYVVYIQLLLDVVSIPFFLYFTGGSTNYFAFFYILVIVTASTISMRDAVIFGLLSLFSYASLFYYELLQMEATGVEHATHIQDSLLLLSVLGIAFLLLLFQTSYYTSLAKMRKKDEELRKFKEDFMFKTIHDLRNPATVIRYSLESIRTALKSNDKKEIEENLSFIEEANSNLLNLVEDTLTVGKTQSSKFPLKRESINLTEILQRINKLHLPLTEERGVEITYNPKEPAYVIGDRKRLKEIFENLIDNALKYNKEGGAITIEHEETPKYINTKIRDSGIGIKKEDMGDLFSPYFRSSQSAELPGTGLGLYIVKSLAERMGGSVHAKSEEGEGTVFEVSLPKAST